MNMQEVKEILLEQGDKFGQRMAEFEDRVGNLEADSKLPPRSGSTGRGINMSDAEKFFRTGDAQHLPQGRQMGMNIGSSEDGGYTHVPELGNSIMSAVGEVNPLVSEVRRISINANVYHQLFTVSRSSSGRAAELGTRNDTEAAKLARVEATLYELYAVPQVTSELLNASQFDLGAYIQSDVVSAFDEALGTEFISGTGTNESKGILTAATDTAGDFDSPPRAFGTYQLIDASGVNSPAEKFDYVDLVDLVHALPVRYRQNAKFFMATGAIQHARSLLDSQGMPIWRDAAGGIAGAPQSILGYPVIEVPQLPALDTNSKSVMFGDMRAAYAFIQHSLGLGILRDPYTTKGAVKWYIRLQCVGHPMDTRALKVLRCR